LDDIVYIAKIGRYLNRSGQIGQNWDAEHICKSKKGKIAKAKSLFLTTSNFYNTNFTKLFTIAFQVYQYDSPAPSWPYEVPGSASEPGSCYDVSDIVRGTGRPLGICPTWPCCGTSGSWPGRVGNEIAAFSADGKSQDQDRQLKTPH